MEGSMRQALIAVLALIWGGTATAQDFTSAGYCDPWCEMGRGGGLDCTYRTFNQCWVSTQGSGTHCYENPFLSMCRRPGAAPAKHLHRPRR
jgi:Protein of unknown function (DUF3551)